jgi:hypothetical protein
MCGLVEIRKCSKLESHTSMTTNCSCSWKKIPRRDEMDEGFGYWPPFYDPSPPDPAEGMPAFVLRPVTKITGPGTIGTVMMPIPCYYL